jgi:hydroxyacylglutathione hydrolase
LGCEDVLFICDYVFLKEEGAKLSPFAPPVETKEGFNKIIAVIKDRDITTVCGYKYVTDFVSWKQRADLIP